MTDNRLIEILNHCDKEECQRCPAKEGYPQCLGEDGIFHSAVDLINRQKKEIERLKMTRVAANFRKKLNIKINTHGNPVPVINGEWIDLYTSEDASLKQFEFKIISLGVSMQMPVGYYAHIVPRSSAFKNYGILMTNSMGVIENNYNGDNDVWGFPALAMRDTFIPKGTRICQFRLFKSSEPVSFEQTDYLGNEDRGGFGSTGDR